MSAAAAPASAATATATGSATPAEPPTCCTQRKPAHRADEHHPLDAEVEHARPLGEQLAERGEEERRPVGDRRGEHDDDDAVVHAGASGAAGAAPAGRSTTTR